MKYYIAHNNNNIFHYGELREGQHIESGQPFYKEFETEQELIDFLTEKGVQYINN